MLKLVKKTFIEESNVQEKLADFIKHADILSMGEECLKFEKDFSKYQGRKYSVLFNSGSSANLALIQSLKNLKKIETGDEIGVSALTWATNVMPIIQLGFTPIPFDVVSNSLNVDDCIERNYKQYNESHIKNYNKYTKLRNNNLQFNKLKVLFVTNALGLADNYYRLEYFCKRKGIILIVDNCEGLGSEMSCIRDYNGRKEIKNSGNFGLASTFSFYVSHHLSTIEGGMVCTDDKELANMLKMVRSHGWTRNLDDESRLEIENKYDDITEIQKKYSFYYPAYNLRPTEITGFLGHQQLPYLQKTLDKRDENFRYLHSFIEQNPDLQSLNLLNLHKIPIFGIPVITKTKDLYNKYIQKFKTENIEIRPIISGNIINQPFFYEEIYKEKYGNFYSIPDFKNVNTIQTNGLYCGNHPDYTEEEIEIIAGVLKHD